jgi:LysM repeat protein
LRFDRTLAVALCCLALAGAACGSGSDAGGAPDNARIPTATLPAELPPATVVGGGVVQPGGGATYSIKSGDTLAGVAERFGVSLEDLLATNPGIDPANLHAGDNIKLPAGTEPVTPQPSPTAEPTEASQFPTPIPVTETPDEEPTEEPVEEPTVPEGGTVYVVESGDIPLTIAEKFGITVEELLAANPGIDPRGLQVGDELIIPPPAPETG